MRYPKICAYCGAHYEAKNSRSRYCCPSCRTKAGRRRKRDEAAAIMAGLDPDDVSYLDDDIVSGLFSDLEASVSAIIDASERANPALRPICRVVGERIRRVLVEEGVVDDEGTR